MGFNGQYAVVVNGRARRESCLSNPDFGRNVAPFARFPSYLDTSIALCVPISDLG